MTLQERIDAFMAAQESKLLAEAADALDEALAIARELARLSRCMDALPHGSIGTQVALLEGLERRVGIRA